MKRLFIAMAVGAAALLGGSAANAADNTVKTKAATDVTQRSTDFSSQHRHHHHGHRHHGHRHYGHRHYGHRHYGYRHHRPYYGNSYGYAPRPYYGYGYGGPSVSFGFGGGGYRGW